LHHYSNKIQYLTGKIKHTPKLVHKLDLKLDSNNILRGGGRLQHISENKKEAFPILLPKKSEYTKLVIKFYHKQNKHAGIDQTLSEIRRLS
jgi:hypothetical protein